MENRRRIPRPWLVAAGIAFVCSLLAHKNALAPLQTGFIGATLIVMIWYSAETWKLRVGQQRDSELRNHPWLKATDLVPEWEKEEGGLFGRRCCYLPIRNVGGSPAFDVRIRSEWRLDGCDIPQSGSSTFHGVVLVPGDTTHALVCKVDEHTPGGRLSLGVEILYRSLEGGSGRLHVTFNELDNGFANGPTSYEYVLSDDKRAPTR